MVCYTNLHSIKLCTILKEESILLLRKLKTLIPKPVKIFLRRFQVRYNVPQYISHTSRLIGDTDTSRPAEAAIFIMIAENWNSFESVYRCILEDQRINITVYVFPGHVFTDKPEELNLKLYGEVLSFFARRGINVVKAYDPENNTWISPDSVKADYIFYDELYDIYPPEFSIRQMYRRARICYIPYSYLFAKSDSMLRIVIPEYNFSFVYAFFASSDYAVDYAVKLYSKTNSKYHHVLRLGYPRFDLTYNIAASTDVGGGCSVIWIPRFTLPEDNYGDPSSRTTFFEFRTKVTERALSHTDEYWIVRPHPRDFAQYLSKGLITRDELNQYIFSLENNPRTELDKNKDYLDAFQRSDVMLADFSSVIVEYLAMRKPVIYCGNIEAITDENVRECIYTASSWDEAMTLLDKLKNGIDPLAEKRKAFAAKLSSNGRSGKHIVDFLIDDYYQGAPK